MATLLAASVAEKATEVAKEAAEKVINSAKETEPVAKTGSEVAGVETETETEAKPEPEPEPEAGAEPGSVAKEGEEPEPGSVAETRAEIGAEIGEPTEEQIEKEEKVELKASLDDALKGIPFVGEIIDKNPVAGHAITLFKSVFPGYSERLTNFLSDEKNKEAINGILTEMNKTENANDPKKQAEIFSSQFGEKLELSEEDLKNFTSDAIMSNVNTMKDEIKTKLNENLSSSPSLRNSDLPGEPKIERTGNNTIVTFEIEGKGTGGKRKTKKTSKSKTSKSKTGKSNKSKKSKKTKTKTSKKRTHKKKSKK